MYYWRLLCFTTRDYLNDLKDLERKSPRGFYLSIIVIVVYLWIAGE